jgi:glycosyltransferase involved in cell wall biosynthesis
MRICIAAPIATADLAHLLALPAAGFPAGYTGAPLTGVLIEALLQLGHSVHALTLDYRLPPRAPVYRAQGPGLTFEVLPGRRRAWRFEGGRPGRALDLFRDERQALALAISAAAPDLVHAHWSYEFALGALDSGLPHVVTAHDSPLQIIRYTRRPYRVLRWLMAREALRRARCLTAVSGYVAAQVQGMARVPVQVVPNPVAPRVLGLGRVRSAPARRRVAMVCNGWDRLKNPEPALQGFARWRASEPMAELHAFGADFGAGESAQRWAQAQGVEAGVHFRGRLPHRELLDELAQADVMLHPSLEESFGVVLAEAMGLGLPVVAGRASGAVPSVLGADTQGRAACGLLTDVSSPAAIAAALAGVFDSEYAARSSAGLERARTAFSPATVVKAYAEVYRQVLHARASSARRDTQQSGEEATP